MEFTDLIDINIELAKRDELIDIALFFHNLNFKNHGNKNNNDNINNKRKSHPSKCPNNTSKFDFDLDASFTSNPNSKLTNGWEKCDNTKLIGNTNNIPNYKNIKVYFVKLKSNKNSNENDV